MRSSVSAGWDHPRACGAHTSSTALLRRSVGSSPRMRGSLIDGHLGCKASGIIPAHAGLTRTRRQQPRGRRDHPRACGAHNSAVPSSTASRGSSPRMRGSQICRDDIDMLVGIIPAHAGLTRAGHRYRSWLRDHPRACGAHTNSFRSR